MAAQKYGYNVNTDYSAEIEKAIEAQDYRRAGILEQQRNEKIRGEGMEGKYPTTSHFTAYLPKTDQINTGLDNLQGDTFSYNHQTDPTWQALRKEFLREADRQTRDTLAAYAGQTGGMPSTAAVSAAQQAGNYQRAQLTDKIPELYDAAYKRWLQGQENQRANLNLLHGIDSDRANQSLTQQQWLWQQQQAEIERNDRLQQQALQNAMNRWAVLEEADEKVAAVLGVPVGTPTSDARYQRWSQQLAERQQAQSEQQASWQQAMGERQQTQSEQQASWSQQMSEREMANAEAQQALQNQQNTRNDAYELVLKLVGMGLMPQDELLQAAGISSYKASIQQLANKNAQLIAAGGAGGAGGSGGSRYSRDYSPPAVEPPASPPAGNTEAAKQWLLENTPGQFPAMTVTEDMYSTNNLSSYGRGVLNLVKATSGNPATVVQQAYGSGSKAGEQLTEAQIKRDKMILAYYIGNQMNGNQGSGSSNSGKSTGGSGSGSTSDKTKPGNKVKNETR